MDEGRTDGLTGLAEWIPGQTFTHIPQTNVGNPKLYATKNEKFKLEKWINIMYKCITLIVISVRAEMGKFWSWIKELLLIKDMLDPFDLRSKNGCYMN